MNLTDGLGFIMIHNKLWYYGHYKEDLRGNIVKSSSRRFLPIHTEAEFILMSKYDSDMLFLSNDGNAYYYGLYPGNEAGSRRSELRPINFEKKFISLSRSGHCLFLTTIGDVYGCGYNSTGQIKHGGDVQYYDPIKIDGIPEKIKSVQCMDFYSVFLGQSGTVYLMGNNYEFGSIGITEEDLNECGTNIHPIMKDIIKITAKNMDLTMIDIQGRIYILVTNPFTPRYPLSSFITCGTREMAAHDKCGIYELDFDKPAIDVKINSWRLYVLTACNELYIIDSRFAISTTLEVEGWQHNTSEYARLIASQVADFGHNNFYAHFLILSCDQKLYHYNGKNVSEIINVPPGPISLGQKHLDRFKTVKRANP